jgi:uncharacterized protein (DUF2344 family)
MRHSAEWNSRHLLIVIPLTSLTTSERQYTPIRQECLPLCHVLTQAHLIFMLIHALYPYWEIETKKKSSLRNNIRRSNNKLSQNATWDDHTRNSHNLHLLISNIRYYNLTIAFFLSSSTQYTLIKQVEMCFIQKVPKIKQETAQLLE